MSPSFVRLRGRPLKERAERRFSDHHGDEMPTARKRRRPSGGTPGPQKGGDAYRATITS